MSVENIWPNKVEYSIVVPQKAIVFGSSIPLETRLTPLLKGLELGDITINLMEMHDVLLQTVGAREHRREKQVASWTRVMSREEHWHEMIEDTGQEGWVMNTTLDLPKKLGQCIQDVNVLNVKVRHKLKIVVALKNPDGHISEVRNAGDGPRDAAANGDAAPGDASHHHLHFAQHSFRRPGQPDAPRRPDRV